MACSPSAASRTWYPCSEKNFSSRRSMRRSSSTTSIVRLRPGSCARFIAGYSSGGFHWKVYNESRSLQWLALQSNKTVMSFHDAVNHGQTESCSLTDLLGGEEGLEDSVLNAFLHPGAGVGNFYAHILSGFCVAVLQLFSKAIAVLIVNPPPSGIASRALTQRLSST